jgi:hypothetical protein
VISHLNPRSSASSAAEFSFSLRPVRLCVERLKKYCSQFGARIFGFWRGFGEGAGLKNPVTGPKRRQKTKKTALSVPSAEWLQYFLNRSSSEIPL